MTMISMPRPYMAQRLVLAVCLAAVLAPFTPAQNNRPTTAPAGEAPTLPRGKRLILKDGADQLVSSYEIHGDRVRYYSVERSQWEEIPTDLVDWDATRKAEAAQAQQQQAMVEKVRAAEAARKAEPLDVDASVEAAPGVFLPPGEGLFVFDGKAVLPLEQAEAGIKVDKGQLLKQVLVPIPIVPSRRNVQLAGKQAKFRITNPQPEFYLRTADAREPQIELIRAQVRGDDSRVRPVAVMLEGIVKEEKEVVVRHGNLTRT